LALPVADFIQANDKANKISGCQWTGMDAFGSFEAEIAMISMQF
jgi:hypothetical protein